MNWKKYHELRKIEYYDLSHSVVITSNGVGPRYLNYLIPQFNFRNAADHHDVMYAAVQKSKGEYYHLFSKEEADKRFLTLMLKACKEYSGNKRKVAEWFARRYYKAVKHLGHPFYDAWFTRTNNYIGVLFNIKEWQ